MDIRYTVAFLKRGQEILLLNRMAAPLMGLWNGVGGKLEEGETASESIIREIKEETGITVTEVQDKGLVTWDVDGGIRQGGMHVFTVELPEDYYFSTPLETEEGILEWKTIDWILDSNNLGISQNIPYFGQTAWSVPLAYHHHFDYQEGKIVNYTKAEIKKKAGQSTT